MTTSRRLQTQIFNIIKSEFSPISIDNIVTKLGIFKREPVMYGLSALEQQELIVGSRRQGITYYQLSPTKNHGIKSKRSRD